VGVQSLANHTILVRARLAREWADRRQRPRARSAVSGTSGSSVAVLVFRRRQPRCRRAQSSRRRGSAANRRIVGTTAIITKDRLNGIILSGMPEA
jgi:hypothetical protein